MKSSILYLLPFVLFGFLLGSCNKDKDDSPSPSQSSEYFFECELGGTSFKASGLNAYAADFPSTYTMYGLGPDDFVVYVSVDKTLGIGTHPMDAFSNAYVSYGDGRVLSTILDGGSGTVSISEITEDKIIGRFDCKVIDFDDPTSSMEISNGKFEVEIRL
ncbi:MAG: hypothetical protein AAF990_04420 [Bacteroidota bacterium]